MSDEIIPLDAAYRGLAEAVQLGADAKRGAEPPFVLLGAGAHDVSRRETKRSKLRTVPRGTRSLFVETLQGAASSLKTLVGTGALQDDRDFARSWLVQVISSELLRYSIEDDYVALRQRWWRAIPALAALVDPRAEEATLFSQLVEAITICREIATAKQPQFLVGELHSPRLRALSRIMRAESPLFHASSGLYPCVPILDDTASRPEYTPGIMAAFAERLEHLKKDKEVSCLCFVEKVAGPTGALTLLSGLVSALGLPACVYRENYWSSRAELSGYQPQKGERVAMVYDLIVSGHGILEAAKHLRRNHSVTVKAAVVVLSYGKAQQIIGSRKDPIFVEAIDSYETFAKDIDKITRENVRTTKTVSVLAEKTLRRGAASPWGDAVAFPPTKGGRKMNRDPRWRMILGAYANKELRALTFRSDRGIDRVIELLEEDSELRGMPYEIAGGLTLLVPHEGIPWIKRKAPRIGFVERPVVARA